jgi:hypothetical protein
MRRWQFEKDEQSVQIEVDGPITLDEATRPAALVVVGEGT